MRGVNPAASRWCCTSRAMSVSSSSTNTVWLNRDAFHQRPVDFFEVLGEIITAWKNAQPLGIVNRVIQ